MKVHFLGIGGIGMSGVAGLAKALGFEVTGSEEKPLYPPSSLLLKDLDIPIFKATKENITLINPDLIVVGNAIKRDHPEVLEALSLNLPLFSFPQFIRQYLLPNKKPIVVAGTHGKTTTSALLSFLLYTLGEDPSFLVGGILKQNQRNFQLGKGRWFVLEGDEYPSAFFEPIPKFFHYHPYALILTSLEYDHIDVYKSWEDLKEAFRKLVLLVPKEGVIIYCYDDPNLKNLIQEVSPSCKIISYGQSPGADYRLLDYELSFNPKGFLSLGHFQTPSEEKFTLLLPLPGFYNLLNTLSLISLLEFLGFSIEKVLPQFLNFKGIKRRQEIISLTSNTLIVDDFAHHPTAVKLTLQELKAAYKPQKTILFFEPRTNSSKRRFFQEDYEKSLLLADDIFIKPPPGLSAIPEEERIDLEELKGTLRQAGKKSMIIENLERLRENFPKIEKKTLIVFMSSASMEKEIEEVRNIVVKNENF